LTACGKIEGLPGEEKGSDAIIPAMLPQNHFVISSIAMIPVAAVISPQNIPQAAGWVVLAGAVSAAIDLDVLALIYLKGKDYPAFRLFYNPLNLFTKFKLFMETLVGTGMIKVAMKSHFTTFILLPILTWFFWPAYFLPIFVAVITHLLSDIPNIKILLSRYN
jgi:hypothetical protein